MNRIHTVALDVISTQEAAEILNVRPATVLSMVYRGKLRPADRVLYGHRPDGKMSGRTRRLLFDRDEVVRLQGQQGRLPLSYVDAVGERQTELTTRQAAQVLGVSTSYMWTLIAKGRIVPDRRCVHDKKRYYYFFRVETVERLRESFSIPSHVEHLTTEEVADILLGSRDPRSLARIRNLPTSCLRYAHERMTTNSHDLRTRLCRVYNRDEVAALKAMCLRFVSSKRGWDLLRKWRVSLRGKFRLGSGSER